MHSHRSDGDAEALRESPADSGFSPERWVRRGSGLAPGCIRAQPAGLHIRAPATGLGRATLPPALARAQIESCFFLGDSGHVSPPF